jgi:elongator complex protein 2
MSPNGNVQLEYVAAGGNSHPSAADWATGLLAFGAGINVALWNPDNEKANYGVSTLLAGHTGTVNAVKILEFNGKQYIISGASDNTVRVWRQIDDSNAWPFFEESQCLEGHAGAVNTIATLPENGVFASGAADGTVRVWRFKEEEAKVEAKVELVQSITLKPRFLPLATALARLPTGEIVLAVAGTMISVQVYLQVKGEFELQATLSGHEGWVRSLDFLTRPGSDLLLASASQDKYVRLWRFGKGDTVDSGETAKGTEPIKKSLSNKAHQVGSAENRYAVTFEALLVGHEDWIYSAKWGPLSSTSDSPTLLTASADNSLSLWSVEEASGLWVCQTRLGEISSQKGSTTATGSTGGFWIGLWQPQEKAVVSLGRTGSWRRWAFDSGSDMWLQQSGISGHTQEVQSVAWAPNGSYLLSTGSDQTTRMLAEWKRDGIKSWHEIARPQIHGYDLNCLATLTPHQFVSGAEEKLLRVFNKPKTTHALLSALSGNISSSDEDLALPDSANIPVLGLSNKAISAVEDGADEPTPDPKDASLNPTTDSSEPTASLTVSSQPQPPVEDHLARHTLWPEHEKLYGHGYEISCVAANTAGTLVATACKASSLDHAVIRLYETKDWREIKPPLSAHNLTVTSLSFSPDDRYLLSVGRDRQWALFQLQTEENGSEHKYALLKANPKGHSRMILDCAWVPTTSADGSSIFATAGRDKSIKFWRITPSSSTPEISLIKSFPIEASVTAVAFSPDAQLAYGTEQGRIGLVTLSESGRWEDAVVEGVRKDLGPAKTVTSLRWRPGKAEEDGGRLLAVGSEDGGLRLVRVG